MAIKKTTKNSKTTTKKSTWALNKKKHFLKILERWKQILRLEQTRTADKIQNNSNHFADDSDRATHEEGFTLEIKTRERERRLLSKIDQSINGLIDHDYGFCLNPNCGIEIGIRRLEARPTARLCIDCKTLEEITEKQQYG